MHSIADLIVMGGSDDDDHQYLTIIKASIRIHQLWRQFLGEKDLQKDNQNSTIPIFI